MRVGNRDGCQLGAQEIVYLYKSSGVWGRQGRLVFAPQCWLHSWQAGRHAPPGLQRPPAAQSFNTQLIKRSTEAICKCCATNNPSGAPAQRLATTVGSDLVHTAWHRKERRWAAAGALAGGRTGGWRLFSAPAPAESHLRLYAPCRSHSRSRERRRSRSPRRDERREERPGDRSRERRRDRSRSRDRCEEACMEPALPLRAPLGRALRRRRPHSCPWLSLCAGGGRPTGGMAVPAAHGVRSGRATAAGSGGARAAGRPRMSGRRSAAGSGSSAQCRRRSGGARGPASGAARRGTWRATAPWRHPPAPPAAAGGPATTCAQCCSVTRLRAALRCAGATGGEPPVPDPPPPCACACCSVARRGTWHGTAPTLRCRARAAPGVAAAAGAQRAQGRMGAPACPRAVHAMPCLHCAACPWLL